MQPEPPLELCIGPLSCSFVPTSHNHGPKQGHDQGVYGVTGFCIKWHGGAYIHGKVWPLQDKAAVAQTLCWWCCLWKEKEIELTGILNSQFSPSWCEFSGAPCDGLMTEQKKNLGSGQTHTPVCKGWYNFCNNPLHCLLRICISMYQANKRTA